MLYLFFVWFVSNRCICIVQCTVHTSKIFYCKFSYILLKPEYSICQRCFLFSGYESVFSLDFQLRFDIQYQLNKSYNQKTWQTTTTTIMNIQFIVCSTGPCSGVASNEQLILFFHRSHVHKRVVFIVCFT